MKTSLVAVFIIFLAQSSGWASNYSIYEKYLGAKWPLLTTKPGACKNPDPRYWQDEAQRMISLAPLQKQVALNADEVMVLRNLLISQAYNRLFVSTLQGPPGRAPEFKYFWIASGSQASVTVGHALQEGLATKYPRGSRQRRLFEKLLGLHEKLPPTSSQLLKNIPEVKRKVAEGNLRVYSDIFWQHLAYLQCGHEYIMAVNRRLAAQAGAQGDEEKEDHYHRFMDVWMDMEWGRYLEANMKLIWIEQHNILQKYMYRGLDAKAATSLLFFNDMAKAELAGPQGRAIQSFTDYSLEHGLYPNLSYFPTRFKWMKYVVGEQSAYLEELATRSKVEAVLEKSLSESYQAVLHYYQ